MTNLIKKYYIRKKWKFLREANIVRRRLEAYADMEVEEYPDKIVSREIVQKTCKTLAIIEYPNCFGSAERAYYGGVERALKQLKWMDERNEEFGFLK